MKRDLIILVVLVFLIIVSIVQAIQIRSLKADIGGGKISSSSKVTGAVVNQPSSQQADHHSGTPSNLQNLPKMVGGC